MRSLIESERERTPHGRFANWETILQLNAHLPIRAARGRRNGWKSGYRQRRLARKLLQIALEHKGEDELKPKKMDKLRERVPKNQQWLTYWSESRDSQIVRDNGATVTGTCTHTLDLSCVITQGAIQNESSQPELIPELNSYVLRVTNEYPLSSINCIHAVSKILVGCHAHHFIRAKEYKLMQNGRSN